MKEIISNWLNKVWMTYWTGAIILIANVLCVFATFDSQGASFLLFWNLIGVMFSIRIILSIYNHKSFIRKSHLAVAVAMATVHPKMNAIFEREHQRLGLKDGDFLTQGQLLAVHDEMDALMEEAQRHYKSLVDESKIDKP